MGVLSESVWAVGQEKPKSVEASRSAESVMALEMMANGSRMVDVEEATGISVYTLMRMRMDHGAAIAERRKVAAEKAELVAEQYGELLLRRAEQLFCDGAGLAKINPKDLAVAYGIMQDHRAKLSGEAGVVVEHRKVLGIEEAKAMIEAARQRVKEEAIDV
jgi:ribosomal protein L7/L12